MLKASQKSYHRKLLQTQTQLLTAPKRGVTNHHVYNNNGDFVFENRKDFLDTNAHVKHHVGFLLLNREHRYNTLTSNYLKNIKRCLNTLYQDDIVKVIYMTGGKRKHFSNGTDFRTLLHHKKEENYDAVTFYLTDLYGLQTLTAKINKPILGVAPGHAYNSGAAWLQSTGLPISTLDSQVAFNDVTYGFVPHGGSTYYLSRLPGELGTFLAVTGLPLTGIDAVELKLADDLVHLSKPYEKTLLEIMINVDVPIPNSYHLSDRFTIDAWKTQLDIKADLERQAYIRDIEIRNRKRHENTYTEEFFEPKDRKPMTIGDADYKYKKMLERYNDLHFRNMHEESYLETDKVIYQNYFRYLVEHIRAYTNEEYSKSKDTIHNNIKTINRCFYSNTVEEIIENLKQENSPFAQKCLEQIQRNSMLSMKLALKMVRDARNLDYKGCLQNEINVALNKIQDKEFDLGISQVLLKPGKQGAKPEFRRDISQDEVQSYFQKNKFTEAVELDVVEKALLPTRFYYDKFADQMRLWINEDTTPQPEIREHFEHELKAQLRQQGIDLRDRALTIKDARDALYKQEMMERTIEAYGDRLKTFMHDDKLKERYFNQARNEIQKFKDQPKIFYEKVNEKIQQIFENAYLEKLSMVYEKSKEVHNLEKRRMYIRFKKFLFQSRILTYSFEEFDRIFKQLQSLPFKEIHLTEKWDETYLTKPHPELQRSVLYHLSKAVGKTTLAPVELARQYMTNPDMAKQLTHYTFDLKELKALRKDILSNPEKYEQLLKQDNGTFYNKDRFTPKEIKTEEWNYWYRVLNDGHTPWDNVYQYQNLLAYKEFVEGVEKNALNTLKVVVQRLINDFEAQEGVNDIQEFTQQQKESKREALERLMSMMYGAEYQKQQSKKKSGSAEATKLLANSRPISDIKRHVNNLLLQDQHMRALIPQENPSNNGLIESFKKSILDDLYQMLEFVLINNDKTNSLPKNVLEERLAAITNPKTRGDPQSKAISSLQMIDQYLADVNAEQTIKNAIQLVKPYFFMSVGEKLDEEANRVLEGFKIHNMFGEYLQTYYIQRSHPELFHSKFFTYINSFHAERERLKYLDAAYPEISTNYKLKLLLSKLGELQADKNSSLEAQESELAAVVNSDTLKLKQINEGLLKQEQSYVEDITKFREQQMKKPYNNEEDKEELFHNDPQYRPEHLNNEQELQMCYDVAKVDRVMEFLDANAEAICGEMTNADWLHIVWALFTQHGYDVRRMFRYHFEPEKFVNRDFEQEMRNIFGGRKDLTFEGLAEYAGFLRKLFEQADTAFQARDAESNLQQVHDFMLKQSEEFDDLSKNSLFQQMVDQRNHLNMRDKKGLREELLDFTSLERTIMQNKKLRENISELSKNAPADIQQRISSILDSDSKYVNLSRIEELLRKKDYEAAVDPSHLIDQKSLIADVKKGRLVQDFMRDYQNLSLDVVSLAQAKETILNAQQTMVNESTDKKLQAQALLVLDYIQNSLKYVPHERRKEIKLGEFMKRHQFLNAGSPTFNNYADQILKNKIENTLGKTLDLNAAEVIDWEYAGSVTNPTMHMKKDEKILKALKKGHGYDEQTEMEEALEFMDEDLKEFVDEEATQMRVFDEETGNLIAQDENVYNMEEVLMDAKKMAELKSDFVHVKNYYENEILQTYASPDFEPSLIETLVQRYTELRLKDLMLQDGFKKKVNSNNGHIYLKVLKEEIANELQLSQKADVQDLLFHKTVVKDQRFSVDAEGRYNTSSLINDQAVGYDNLAERAANPEKNRELAHETMFDKLLSEYFTNKRSAIGSVNELMAKMDEQFDNREFKEGHKYRTEDKMADDQDSYVFDDGVSPLSYRHLEQQRGKDDLKSIKPQDFNDMMELDIATSQALQNNKNGLSFRLRQDLPEELQNIPEYYNQFDVRRPPVQYVDDKLTEILNDVFEIRRKLEKTFSRNDLIAYDRILLKHLTHETILPKLKNEIEVDYNTLNQLQQMFENAEEGATENVNRQFMKAHNNQAQENKENINEDSLYKFITYSAMLEKKRREDINKARNNDDYAFGLDSFEEFYKGELLQDAKNPPRPINEEDYKGGKRVPNQQNLSEGFLTKAEREEAYFREFEMYKENKKETIERNQLFFVLEQFFAYTSQQKGPLNKAQEAIMEYFKDTENTYFFDRNKIQ